MTQKEISIAPMLDWTDRHFRFFLRQICRHPLLYTEMINEHAIVLGDTKRLLDYHPSEQPIALQIGGSTPDLMAKCAVIATDYGFKEININAGCPSTRVQAGTFGACLMAKPHLVAECIDAMKDKTPLPITVKTRIALEGDGDGYDELVRFVHCVRSAGCQKFIIHARKARLKGLTPKENREKMPLNYPLVYQLKQDFHDLNVIINGNITSTEAIDEHLTRTDGVMIGRRAYADPYFLATVDSLYYHDNHPVLSREEIIEKMIPYLESQTKQGIKLHTMTRHLMGLYFGQPKAKAFKQTLMLNDLDALKAFLIR